MHEILIVDDDPQFHFITSRLLQSENLSLQYSSYTDSVQALNDLMGSYFRAEMLPKVILLDLQMPEINGWSFLDVINNMSGVEGNQPSVYIVTSSVDPSDKQKATLYSCVKGFISKPLTSKDMEEVSLNIPSGGN